MSFGIGYIFVNSRLQPLNGNYLGALIFFRFTF